MIPKDWFESTGSLFMIRLAVLVLDWFIMKDWLIVKDFWIVGEEIRRSWLILFAMGPIVVWRKLGFDGSFRLRILLRRYDRTYC